MAALSAYSGADGIGSCLYLGRSPLGIPPHLVQSDGEGAERALWGMAESVK